MKPRWEMLTGWKVTLETDEKSFEYFNKESLIPGQIYRIHVLNGAPIIVEFKQFGYGYNYSMTKTYPRILICDGAVDVQIEDVTHIFAYNGDDDEDASSESTKTADVSGFKDFVVSQHLYHVNEKLKGVETVSGIFTDKMQITGELKIAGFNRVGKEDHVRGMYVDLPTDDEIYISALDNPLFELNNCAHPSFKDNPTVFVEEDESELRWNQDLVPGDFYIMFNETGGKRIVLIKWIHNDKIEYVVFNSEYNNKTLKYYFKETTYELRIEYARGYKFIPINDIK